MFPLVIFFFLLFSSSLISIVTPEPLQTHTLGHICMIAHKEQLIATAQQLVAVGKGLLAADESTSTVGKRLASINVENNQDNRVALREMLFSTPGIAQHISGKYRYCCCSIQDWYAGAIQPPLS
jgi:hypothetical protein